jgi:hypothetical protein
VSWKTTASSRASGLIAYEFHARTAQELSPVVAPSLFAFVPDLAGRFSSKRRVPKLQEKSTLLVPGASLLSGGKKEKQEGDAKAGCSSGAGWSGGKYPEKFTIMELLRHKKSVCAVFLAGGVAVLIRECCDCE